jgi:hypothetical protein
MALSPASTRSIKMIASNADHQGVENNSIKALLYQVSTWPPETSEGRLH